MPSRPSSVENLSSKAASPPTAASKANHPVILTPGHIQSLAPPPPAPHGPRLLAAAFPRSRTPSPERPISIILDSSPRKNKTIADIYESSDDEEKYDAMRSPIGLSEKALGKRRVIDHERDRECFSDLS